MSRSCPFPPGPQSTAQSWRVQQGPILGSVAYPSHRGLPELGQALSRDGRLTSHGPVLALLPVLFRHRDLMEYGEQRWGLLNEFQQQRESLFLFPQTAHQLVGEPHDIDINPQHERSWRRVGRYEVVGHLE